MTQSRTRFRSIRTKTLSGIALIMLVFLLAIGSNLILQGKSSEARDSALDKEEALMNIEKLNYLARSTDAQASRYLLGVGESSAVAAPAGVQAAQQGTANAANATDANAANAANAKNAANAANAANATDANTANAANTKAANAATPPAAPEGDGTGTAAQPAGTDPVSRYKFAISQVEEQVKTMLADPEDAEASKALATFETVWASYLKANESAFKLYESGKSQQAAEAFGNNPLDASLNSLITYRMQILQEVKTSMQTSASYEAWVKRISAGVTALAILLGAVIAFALASRISRPVRQAAGQLKDIAEGDADLTKRLAVHTGDEIEEMSAHFNRMLANLAGLVRHIRSSAARISVSSAGMRAISANSRETTGQIREALRQYAHSAEEQVKELRGNELTIQEMSLGIAQIAEHVQEVTNSAIESAEQAESGNGVLQDAIRQMETIGRSIGDLSAVLDGLAARSGEIEQIVTSITEIAAQTNLLALNASIEAARAGEHGRGFTVVAQEVKKLALQSGEAANQVIHSVQGIRTDTDSALKSMKASTLEVRAGTDRLAQAGCAFRQISGSISGVSGQVQGVSAAAQELAASSEEIVHSMTRLAEVSGLAAAENHRLVETSNRQLTDLEELAAAADTLALMSDSLQEAIARFTIGETDSADSADSMDSLGSTGSADSLGSAGLAD